MSGTTSSPPDDRSADVLVVGSGIGGCAAALAAARRGADVLVATKASEPADATTHWAQGGVAVAAEDPATFRADVLAAADGEADPDAVDTLVAEANDAVADVLVETLGVEFDVDGERPADSTTADRSSASIDEFAQCREAGHSTERILHVEASTGKHVLGPFLAHLADHEAIRVLEDTAALDLLTDEGRVAGALLERDGDVRPATAGATVLATGGIGDCYRTSTNPRGTTGDGIAMAALAGAETTDEAYVQFHPTAFPGGDAIDRDALGESAAGVADDADSFLVSEAVRGAGGVLRNAEGDRFMPEVHPDADLAPRDVVARAVRREIDRTGGVVLDVTGVPFRDRFPDLAALCDQRGIDPDAGIPVAPAQHFLCGGVAVDDRGRASLGQLFAVGECARTGVHGANRLASTSLLEGLVWGRRAGETAAAAAADDLESPNADAVDGAVDAAVDGAVDAAVDSPDDPGLPDGFTDAKFRRLRATMDEYVGIERSTDGLRTAATSIRRLKGEVDAYTRTRTSRELYELRNAVICGLLVTRAAAETEPAGCHHLVDDGAADDRTQRSGVPHAE
ncbi:MAG: L-aspartate oxidase [Halopenitus sp.]